MVVAGLGLAKESLRLAPHELELFPPPGHLERANLGQYLLCIPKLGGYLARARDPAPGNIVMWRGLSRLHDLVIGYDLPRIFVGN